MTLCVHSALTHTHARTHSSLGAIPGTCIVVMVVVVIRVVVVSSSMDSGDMGFLALVWLAAEELRAVVSSPGEITVDSARPSPGTACVGLVVVPARGPFSNEQLLSLHYSELLMQVQMYLKTLPGTPYSAGRRGSGHPEDKCLGSMLAGCRAQVS